MDTKKTTMVIADCIMSIQVDLQKQIEWLNDVVAKHRVEISNLQNRVQELEEANIKQ